MLKFFLACCLVIGLSGIAQAESPKTVSWYLNHPEEMKEKAAWCSESADRNSTVECRNVVSAKWGRGKKDVPDLEPNSSPKSAEWYLAHSDEMKARLAWCNDSADREQTPDCQNVHQANHKSWGQRKGVPKF